MTQGKIAKHVHVFDVVDEIEQSFLEYSLSVITSRALPDVRDGLKPVQRRILYAMYRLGLKPDVAHRKCVKIIGDTMGSYHPHGDSSIYDALVRLGQDFSYNIPLVHPHGNFGTSDERAAAARYTEARLSSAAMFMLDSIDENTVDFKPNFDGLTVEPARLPTMLPNLVINGVSGIAVGMATNIAPHNPGEVLDVLIAMLDKRRKTRISIDDVLRLMPAPDFPTASSLIDDGGVREAYLTGKGVFRIRATAEVGQISARRKGITIRELPYQVGPEQIVEQINNLLSDEKLEGVNKVTNLSDRKEGLRIVVECKTGVNPETILQKLYSLTSLESSFSSNNVVLVNGRPETLGIIDLLQHFVDHRLEVVVRRSQFRLEKAQDRLHIVEGLLIALKNIDLVVKTIRASKDTGEARTKLQKALKLSEIQANHILEMPLRRLTSLEIGKIKDEAQQLKATIAELQKLLADEELQKSMVRDELVLLRKEVAYPRKTQIINSNDLPKLSAANTEAVDVFIEDVPCVVTLSTSGLIGMGALESKPKTGRHDLLVREIKTTSQDTVGIITNKGRVLRVTANDLPHMDERSRGLEAKVVFDMEPGETVVGCISQNDPRPLMLITVNGIAKRVSQEEIAKTKNGISLISLKSGDTVASAFQLNEVDEFLMITSDAQIIRSQACEVSVQGRLAAGVTGMRLKNDATVVAALPLECSLLAVASLNGLIKTTLLTEIPLKKRGGSGVRLAKLDENDSVTSAHTGETIDLYGITKTGALVALGEPTRRDNKLLSTKEPIQSVGHKRGMRS